MLSVKPQTEEIRLRRAQTTEPRIAVCTADGGYENHKHMLRPFETKDQQAILTMNEESVDVLSPMDAERFDRLRDLCSLLRVIEDNGEVAGFLMGFCRGTDYDSINYRWFSENYDDFLYIDRVVVSGRHRGRGMASRFYEYAIDWSRQRGLCCLVAEIDIEPRNEPSLTFHERFGFEEVDRLAHTPTKIVSLQRLAIT
jgi:predicted GNAT superfamily acetyltransferase